MQSAGALRLGLVTRDARGFDMTKWHHLHYLHLSSHSDASPESIKGFSSLKVVQHFNFFRRISPLFSFDLRRF